MYPNLRAEMARQNMTLAKLCKAIGKHRVSTVSQMLNGKTRLTLDDAEKIRTALKVDMTLDELFQREG